MTKKRSYSDDKKRATYGRLDPSVSYSDDIIRSTGMTRRGYLDDRRRCWDDKKRTLPS
ncbi:hypothetical protein [Wolbachia endosymbiont of Oedothorax gibbosus]|uniref:hypothetical protein n=1 Tax=Wolbachia endosymbiont of Oedothorax gibbosus TaxID=931100 RepID=UPI002024695C|nr:hypothetical protein [Wolbachia endosymbiont of Oedothorax gibbosus]